MRGEISEAPRQQWSNVSPATLKTVKFERYFSSALTHRALIVSLSLCNCVKSDSSISLPQLDSKTRRL